MKYLCLSGIILLADCILATLICYLASDYVFYASVTGWVLVTVVSIIAGILCLWPIKNWRFGLIFFANIIVSPFIFMIGIGITLNSSVSIDDPKAVVVMSDELQGR